MSRWVRVVCGRLDNTQTTGRHSFVLCIKSNQIKSKTKMRNVYQKVYQRAGQLSLPHVTNIIYFYLLICN